MHDLSIRLQNVFGRLLDNFIKSLPDVLAGLLLFAVFAVVASVLRHLLRRFLSRAAVDSDVAGMVTRTVFYAILTVGVFEALEQMRVNLAALGVGVGLVSFGVGFALKDILSNFLAGVLILITRPFVNGDQIRLKEYEGTIEAIEMRGTILRTYDGRRVIIPNSEVYTNPVVNNTAYERRRSSFFVTVANGSDLEMVESVAQTALLATPEVLDEPLPDILVRELGDFGIKLEIRVWTAPRQLEVLTSTSAAIKAVKTAFDAHKISMPYPTQVVLSRQGISD